MENDSFLSRFSSMSKPEAKYPPFIKSLGPRDCRWIRGKVETTGKIEEEKNGEEARTSKQGMAFDLPTFFVLERNCHRNANKQNRYGERSTFVQILHQHKRNGLRPAGRRLVRIQTIFSVQSGGSFHGAIWGSSFSLQLLLAQYFLLHFDIFPPRQVAFVCPKMKIN